jgi:hypothetical protein
MTVSEVLMGSGSWTLRFKDGAPRRVLDRLDWSFTAAAAFGHVLIYPTRVDAPNLSATDLLATARYTGVLLEWRDARTVGGEGPAWWLGDSSGRGDVITTAISRTNGTLPQWIGDLVPTSLTTGTVTDPGGTASGAYQWVTRRQALEAVCDAFGVEWIVTPRMRVDVGVATALWSSTPTALVMPRWEGRDASIRSLDAGGVARAQDLREWANAAHVLGPAGVATSSAASGLLDINGNAVTRAVVVQASAATPGTEATVAASERVLRQQTRRHVKLTSKTHDIAGDIATGGYCWVFDPDRGLFDQANEVLVAGQVVRPLKMRAMAQTWPIRQGMGVWFRDGDGELTDLTDYVEFDTGDATVELGAIARTVGNPGGLVGTTESGELKNQVSYGPWITFNPNVLFGASPTNVTSSGRWRRDGTDVVWEAEWVLAGAPGAGDLNLTLPVSIASGGSNAGQIVGQAIMLDSGVGRRTGDVYVDGGGTVTAYIDCARNNYIVRASTTVPWTWANVDAGFASGRYRAPN